MDVTILFGSPNDKEVMDKAAETLDKFGVSYKMHATSAHRSPDRTVRIIKEAEEAGTQIFIAAAGLAAHLAGVVASKTLKPVLGVPMDGGPLKGMDALLATVQMPKGVPVATLAIGSHGAVNAALTAVRILSLNNEELAKKHADYVQSEAENMEQYSY